jgi:hypothetical protein
VEADSTSTASVGIVRNRQVLDFDNDAIPNDFSFHIAAGVRGDLTTPQSLLDTARVFVRVLDTNDNAPVFSQARYTASIREDVDVQPPFAVLTTTATDLDSQFNGRILYELVGGNTSIFAINSLSGAITLSGAVDFEETSSYNLTVMAKDRGPEGGQPRQTANVTAIVTIVDVNDNAPVLNTTTAITVSVYENASRLTEVAWVSATDADSGDNARVTFSLVESPGGGPSTNFDIAADGTVRLTANLDFDSGASNTFQLSIRADDNPTNGDPRLRDEVQLTVIVLDVNDNAPDWAVDGNGQLVRHDTSLAENLAVNSVIATVTATDRDQPNTPQSTLRYSLSQQGNFFAIDPATGQITLTRALDFETATQHQVRRPPEGAPSAFARKQCPRAARPIPPSSTSHGTIIVDPLAGDCFRDRPREPSPRRRAPAPNRLSCDGRQRQ